MQKRFSLSATHKIGIIGGGQLARMSAYQAYRFGFQVGAVTSASGKDPMEEITPHTFRGDVNDYDTLKKLADWADVITLENEFLDSSLLFRLQEETGKNIYPGPDSFRLIEDKRIEKETFRNAGIPVAAFMVIASDDDLRKFGAKHGWPFLLKSSKGGYDGYGNAMVHTMDEAKNAFADLGGAHGREVIAEERIDFTHELAVLVARNRTGTVTYPCVETLQVNHICQTVIAPARIPRQLREQACELAVAATEAINGTGLFAFEFFLTESNEILLNESAPRPHNSGHYTIEACETSQFENHIRAVCGFPPGAATMRKPVAVMVNLLGKHNKKAAVGCPTEVFMAEDAHLHVYGKKDSRVGRKMGHLTILGMDVEDCLKTADNFEKQIIF